jgi:quercetin dioxygenase-like cupin family protein
MNPHPHSNDEVREMAAMCALGTLSLEESRAFEEHAGECEICRSELHSFRETAALIAFSGPVEAPPPGIRDRLLERVRPPAGVQIVRKADGKWRSTPFPGVTYKPLHRNAETRQITVLLKLAPGAAYPAHRHAEAEECLVLEGSLRIGDLILYAGDYERAEASTTHSTIETDEGCLLLILSSELDEFVAS